MDALLIQCTSYFLIMYSLDPYSRSWRCNPLSSPCGTAWKNAHNRTDAVAIPGRCGLSCFGSLLTLSRGLAFRSLASNTPPSTPPTSRTTPSAHPVYCSTAAAAHRHIAQPLPAQSQICNRTRNDGSGTRSSVAMGGEEAVFQRGISGVMQEIIRKEVRNYMVGMEMEKKGHYMQSDAMMINGVIKRMGMSKVD
ncbi:uncharacterized protein LOC130994458 [Salvia miltiorrhiza]|uniref:uncharacterized protein LOC130994458 n=1 Tax=Salvia miltiorrhiza TaxID=226208 RepID=UPI0025AD570C|nr:uncharacterized protein LOC130994458 [Salvia miltiorrhiza]